MSDVRSQDERDQDDRVERWNRATAAGNPANLDYPRLDGNMRRENWGEVTEIPADPTGVDCAERYEGVEP